MTEPIPPVDPIDPFSFEVEREPFEHVDRPCIDFHHTLGWIFWKSMVAMEALGSTFEHVRHVRHMMLTGLQNRGCDKQKVRAPVFDYDVEVMIENGLMVIAFDCRHENDPDLDATYAHVLDKRVIDDDAVKDAVILNAFLDVDVLKHDVSPFGPGDVVMPGNFDRNKAKFVADIIQPIEEVPKTQKIRLVETFSSAYDEAVNCLSDTYDVFQVQMLLSRLALIDMPRKEFNQFMNLAASHANRLADFER